ncbi:MAG: hypothetical protein ACRDUV_24430 [Pseudonocardiaceae bacterium]
MLALAGGAVTNPESDVIGWVALRRVHGGGVARVGSWWVDGGRQVPDYLPAVLDELVTAGLVALEASDPVAEAPLRASLTKAGQARYGELLAHHGGRVAQAALDGPGTAAPGNVLVQLPPTSIEATQTPAGRRSSDPRPAAPGGQPDPPAAVPPWAHRPWCAPDCSFPPGVAEGAHLSRAWSLAPADEPTSRVALRLVEEPGEDGPGEVEVLVSVTERRLADDLDPFDEGTDPSIAAGLADITSSASLSTAETSRMFEELVAFGRCARELSTGVPLVLLGAQDPAGGAAEGEEGSPVV